MKQIKFMFLFFLFGICNNTFCQSDQATIIKTDIDRLSGIVTIYYDLGKGEDNSLFNIDISATVDLKNVNAKSVSGDIGQGIKPGKGKTIIWNAKKDIGNKIEDAFIKVEIIVGKQPKKTINLPQPEIVKEGKGKLIIGICGILAGGGSYALGHNYENESKSSNRILSTFPDPSDRYYSDVLGKSHETVSDDADKNHKKAIIFKAGGATIAAAGVFFIVKHFIDKNQINGNVIIEPILIPNGSFAAKDKTLQPTFGARLAIVF